MSDDWMKGYTRTPETTEQLVSAIRVALKTHPTMRLGQILTNFLGNIDLFNVHDEDMIFALRRAANYA